MSPRHSAVVGALALLLLVSVTPASGQAVLRLGVVASVSDAGFFVAQEKRYFTEEGLSVEFVPFQTAALMVAPLGVGQLDAGGGAVSAGLFNALARGIDLRIVADKGSIRTGQSYEGLVIRKDLVDGGRYRGPADLRGLRIALPGRGISPQVTLALFARQGNLNMEDIQLVIMPFADMPVAMGNRAIDGAILIEPFKTLAVEEKIGVLVDTADKVYPDHQVAVVLYSPAMRREKVDLGRKFMMAYLKAVRDYNDAFGKKQAQKKRDVIAAFAKHTPVKDPSLYEKMVMPYLDPNGAVNRVSLRFDQDWYAQQGFVQQKVNLSLVVDDRFVLHAVEKLGRYQ
ncbi:MAG: ABC transporter substrate-binding protein [Armatimonadota bacterium]